MRGRSLFEIIGYVYDGEVSCVDCTPAESQDEAHPIFVSDEDMCEYVCPDCGFKLED
jgi:hypothetical protein